MSKEGTASKGEVSTESKGKGKVGVDNGKGKMGKGQAKEEKTKGDKASKKKTMEKPVKKDKLADKAKGTMEGSERRQLRSLTQ